MGDLNRPSKNSKIANKDIVQSCLTFKKIIRNVFFSLNLAKILKDR